MNWFSTFLTSSVGRKLVMSLTGLFLIIFLVVHLIGNLQLLAGDGGMAFNEYAEFMTSFGPVKAVSYLLYASILVHAIQGWLLWRKNSAARGVNYAVKRTRTVNTSAGASKNMGWLGTIIFVFILIHMYQFWFQMHWTIEPQADTGLKDLYAVVQVAYTNLGFVIFYVVSMIVIAYHLWHGFQSAFQTLGINHEKYSPFIRALGKIYSVVVPAGFAIIPIVMYLTK